MFQLHPLVYLLPSTPPLGPPKGPGQLSTAALSCHLAHWVGTCGYGLSSSNPLGPQGHTPSLLPLCVLQQSDQDQAQRGSVRLPNEGMRSWRLPRTSALITASYPPSPYLPGTLSVHCCRFSRASSVAHLENPGAGHCTTTPPLPANPALCLLPLNFTHILRPQTQGFVLNCYAGSLQ